MHEPRPHTAAVRGHDLYQTASVAVEALLRVETLPHHIWEPACGPGVIVDVLRRHRHTVWATDLIDYGCPQSESGVDFLATTQTRIDTEAIVTNPPYRLATKFIQHALDMCPRVMMLLRLQYLEGHSKARLAVLDGGKLARVHVFRNRLPMMHRAGWTGPVATSRIAFAWFIWDRDHHGATELRRISWEKPIDRAALLDGLEDAA